MVAEGEGRYTVNAFVTGTSTDAQNSEPVQTTVTYAVVIDRNADWKITDVGGLDGALPVG